MPIWSTGPAGVGVKFAFPSRAIPIAVGKVGHKDRWQCRIYLIVGDLSFISQTLVLPAIVPLLKPGGSMLMLVKPQFELQPGQVGKGGIVTDPAMYKMVEERVRAAHTKLGLTVQAWFESPVQGGDGNHEFFIYSRK